MGIEALAFVMDALMTTCCMYIASKISFVVADFKSLLVLAVIVALVSLIPTVGWVFGVILFVFLLGKATHASIGDCIWVVVFTKVVSMAAFLIFGRLFV
ncbi:hypothetical protein [Vibrio cyclitrophicus]|uniref:hypothetical protein n=1 Tax=Vibrio cyclitrophicus TaxID=47951 RepID=UPI00031B51F3|nr:hypothetical protein [Vibrio cyclitrophicus]OEF36696.1 hypothetical protein OAE_12895 [Vibrio cyclitrophicus 1F289]PME51588.1 hypothetical protein BCV35_05960 [Vibrio cyclitrophicus]PMF12626.1 hypothetical protein BCV20_15590 [Vibrio cyclitrophicus]PMJ80092.1 hypothetical protein BCU15_01450 [Vibrio cyclitrophicus]